MRTTIILSAIGGDIAQGVAAIIREVAPSAVLIGIDTHHEHAGATMVDRFVLVPPAARDEYPTAVTKLVSETSAEYFWPLSEPEIAFWQLQSLHSCGCAMITAGPTAVRAANDKLETARALDRLSIPGPWTLPGDTDSAPPAFPCIWKPRQSSGSRGIHLCRNPAEAEFLKRDGSGFIFQELLPSSADEITCGIYRTTAGQVRTIQLKRRLVGGLTGWCEVIDNPAISNMCEKLANGLEVRGNLNAQLRLTAAGPRLFDLNARVSSTVRMRHLLGFTDVAWTLHEMRGEELGPWVPTPGRTAARISSSILLPTHSAFTHNARN